MMRFVGQWGDRLSGESAPGRCEPRAGDERWAPWMAFIPPLRQAGRWLVFLNALLGSAGHTTPSSPGSLKAGVPAELTVPEDGAVTHAAEVGRAAHPGRAESVEYPWLIPSRKAQAAVIDYLEFKAGRRVTCPAFRPEVEFIGEWVFVHGPQGVDPADPTEGGVYLCERLLAVQRLFSMPRAAQNRLGLTVAGQTFGITYDMHDPGLRRDVYQYFVLPYLDLAPTGLYDAENRFGLADEAYQALRDGGDLPTAASVMKWVLDHASDNMWRGQAASELKDTLDAIHAGNQGTSTTVNEGGGAPKIRDTGDPTIPSDTSGPTPDAPENDHLRSFAPPALLAGGVLLYSQYVPKDPGAGDYHMCLVLRKSKESPRQAGTCATCYVEGDGQLLDPKLLPDGKHVLAKYGEYPDPVKLSPFRYYILDLVKHTWTPGAPVTLS